MPEITPALVTALSPADPSAAVAHFESVLAFETDCWDVHHDVTTGTADFVLLDVRSPELHAAGHLPHAVNLPHARITQRNLAEYPADTVIGGVEGWKDEGFDLVTERTWISPTGRSLVRVVAPTLG